MAKLTVEGVGPLQAKLKALAKAAPERVGAALYQAGNEILADAQTNYVPVGTGALRGSGFVELPVGSGRGASVRLGFNTPYALVVHENPRAGKTQGVSPQGKKYTYPWARKGEWKYLETPLKAQTPEVAAALRQSIDDLVAEVAYQTGSVNVRSMGNAPRFTGNDIIEGP